MSENNKTKAAQPKEWDIIIITIMINVYNQAF